MQNMFKKVRAEEKRVGRVRRLKCRQKRERLMRTHDGLTVIEDGSGGVLKEKRQVTSYEVSHPIIMYIMYGKVYRVRNTV